jgi:hypothetical protein
MTGDKKIAKTLSGLEQSIVHNLHTTSKPQPFVCCPPIRHVETVPRYHAEGTKFAQSLKLALPKFWLNYHFHPLYQTSTSRHGARQPQIDRETRGFARLQKFFKGKCPVIWLATSLQLDSSDAPAQLGHESVFFA